MMSLGMFVFGLTTLAYQDMQRQTVQLRGMAFENAVMACELRP